jgi:hypothetical protein
MIAVLEALADWLDELQAKLDSAHFTLPPRRYAKLQAEIDAFRRAALALKGELSANQQKHCEWRR